MPTQPPSERFKELPQVNSQTSGLVKVIYGAASGVFHDLGGASVGQVFASLRDAFNLPKTVLAYINGECVLPGHRLRANEVLEFCKPTGTKGADRFLTKAQIEAEYRLPPGLSMQVEVEIASLVQNVQGEPLYLESAIDLWLQRSFVGIDRDQLLINLAADIHRIAERLDPPPPDKVGTTYVADRLGCTTDWITELIRKGKIRPNCIVPGSGNGKPWKFFKQRIDRWIEEER